MKIVTKLMMNTLMIDIQFTFMINAYKKKLQTFRNDYRIITWYY